MWCYSIAILKKRNESAWIRNHISFCKNELECAITILNKIEYTFYCMYTLLYYTTLTIYLYIYTLLFFILLYSTLNQHQLLYYMLCYIILLPFTYILYPIQHNLWYYITFLISDFCVIFNIISILIQTNAKGHYLINHTVSLETLITTTVTLLCNCCLHMFW